MNGRRWAGAAAASLFAIGLLTFLMAASPGQDKADTPAGKQVEKAAESSLKQRVTWEYKTFYESTRGDHDVELNKLGEEGWELVALRDEVGNRIRYVFKRQKHK